jgi:hypothetical protein
MRADEDRANAGADTGNTFVPLPRAFSAVDVKKPARRRAYGSLGRTGLKLSMARTRPRAVSAEDVIVMCRRAAGDFLLRTELALTRGVTFVPL